MKKGIAFKGDVDRRVAEKTGMDIRDVKMNTSFINERLIEIMNQPDNLSVYIPKIGTIWPNMTKLWKFHWLSPLKMHKYRMAKQLPTEAVQKILHKTVFQFREKKFGMSDEDLEQLQNEQ